MPWLTGMVHKVPDGLSLARGQGRLPLVRGSLVELWRLARWQRGRIEFSDFLGWYWSNERVHLPLYGGEEIRVWDGGRWPAEVEF